MKEKKPADANKRDKNTRCDPLVAIRINQRVDYVRRRKGRSDKNSA